MKRMKFSQVVAALFALAVSASAQGTTDEPVGRLGLDITGI